MKALKDAAADVSSARRAQTERGTAPRLRHWTAGAGTAVLVVVLTGLGPVASAASSGTSSGTSNGTSSGTSNEAPAARSGADGDPIGAADGEARAVVEGEDSDAGGATAGPAGTDGAGGPRQRARSDDVFIPSEEISEDLSVAFPTDI